MEEREREKGKEIIVGSNLVDRNYYVGLGEEGIGLLYVETSINCFPLNFNECDLHSTLFHGCITLESLLRL